MDNKYVRGNCFSKYLFLWMEPFIFRAFRQRVTFKDLPDLPSNIQVGQLRENFMKIWHSQKNPSLLYTILRQNIFDIILSGIYLAVSNLCELCAIVMGWLILEIVINPEPTMGTHGIIYCCIFTVASFMVAILYPKYIYISLLLDIKTFTQCIIAIFQKSLSLPQDVLNQVSSGRIINMITNDIRSLEYKYYKLLYISGFPLTLIGAGLLLYFLIGPIALVGLGAIAINILVVFSVVPLMGKMRSQNLASTDKRVKFINQVLKNMRVVKMFGLEKLTQRYVEKIRRKEWKYGMPYTMLRTGASDVLFLMGTSLAIYTTFLVTYFTDSPIHFGKAILCFMLYQEIQNCAAQFLLCLSTCVELSVSGKRISEFLHTKASKGVNRQNITLMEGNTCIEIQNLTVEWPNNSKGLDNINLNVSDEPQLIFVTGAVGAGKSTLLLTLCNEISQFQGRIRVNGRAAYSAQESWVFSGTIRDNIIVGNEFEQNRFWKVIAACGLAPDLELFNDGDLTLVGERGVTLSGGQKARVALARTVYTVADIYLLDEPLGAVDAHVGKHIFEECIQGLLRDKVVILATHQTRFVEENNRMIKLENGRIVEDKICKKIKQTDWETFSEIKLKEESNQCEEKEADPDEGRVDLECMTEGERETRNSKPMSTALSEEESVRARMSVFPRYFKTGGLCLTLILLIVTIVSNTAQISFIWWIQKFMRLASITHSYDNTNLTPNYTNQTSTIAPDWFLHTIGMHHLIAITVLIFGSVFFLSQEWITLSIITWRAAMKLHKKMIKSVMGTSMRFFETNPSGRILNRFSKDVGYADFNITITLIDFWILMFMVVFPLVASCVVQKFLILPAIILTIIFLAFLFYYLPSVTQLRGLESLLRSPVYSHISLALQGMTTIRSLGIEQKVEEDLLYHLNAHIKVWITLQSGSVWFLQRLSFIFRLFLVIAVWAAFVRNYYYQGNENIALSFQILLGIPSLYIYVATLAVNLNIMMVAVERIFAYIKLKPEIDNEGGSIMPKRESQSIPNDVGMLYEGSVTFENVYLRYAEDLPMVLRGVSLKVLGGSKMGVVGRTGAGKSSIINALFRLTNLSGGRILIDGVDISHLKLNRLRTQISVIPQDPMLFTGTLRFNLDPFDQFSDSEIWSSLEHVQLRGLIASLQGGLSTTIQEDGSNFSVGEKQLLCLARALLRNTRILVVDEATANVDRVTDAKIQNTLRTSFTNQTVISIAHRLNTVIDYDRIVVLEQGEVVEMDYPHLLLQDDQSYLSKLVSQTDPATQTKLRESAHAAYRSALDN